MINLTKKSDQYNKNIQNKQNLLISVKDDVLPWLSKVGTCLFAEVKIQVNLIENNFRIGETS